MKKITLYDAAVNEVRGDASQAEQQMLESDPLAWRDALMSVIDEMDSQFRYRSGVFDDETEFMDEGSEEYKEKMEAYQAWKLKGRTFKKHIEARLASVSRMAADETVTADDFAEAISELRASEDDDEAYDKAIDDLYRLLDRFDRARRLQ